MEQSKILSEVEAQIGEGNTEKALSQLLELLDRNPAYAEFAQTIRINQADLFQVKSQVLRGTISTDNERTANNQIRDNVFQVIQLVKSGKTTFDLVPSPKNPQAWRYYTAGGVVALAVAFLSWNLFFTKKEECPEYGKQKTQRVMILPFKKIDAGNTTRPEFNLSDAFNDLVAADSKLSFKAESDVNEAYDIDKNYPNPSKAAEIGKNCGVQLVVWGKTSDSKDTVEVRYRFVNPFAVKDSAGISGYLSNLELLNPEGVWRSDVKTIARLLYFVVAMQEGPSELAYNILNGTSGSSLMASAMKNDMMTVPDTTSVLLLAEAYMQNPAKKDSALALFNEVLAHYPDNYRALRGRGIYFLKEKDYISAVQDLHQAQPDPSKADPVMLRVRTDAYLKVGWPEMARRDLEEIKKDTSQVKKQWIKEKERVIQDSIKVYEKILEQATTAAQSSTKSTTSAKLNVAKANIALGNPEEAVKYSEYVNKLNPKNKDAIETTLEAYAQQGDVQKAVETIEKAERKGVNTKSVKFKPAPIVPLEVTDRSGSNKN